MTASRQSKKILSQIYEDQPFHTWQAEWALHGLALLGGTRWPGFLQLSSFSNSFPACGCRFSEVHQRAKSYQVNFFPCYKPPCTAWSTWPTWPSSGSSRWRSRSRPSAGFARRTRWDCWDCWAKLLASAGLPAQGWLYRADDPSICCQLWFRAKRLAGGFDKFQKVVPFKWLKMSPDPGKFWQEGPEHGCAKGCENPT